MQSNYYDTLGVAKSATTDEIKKAFRTLAHKYHPDKKGGDEKRFKEVSEAYAVLSDEKKRAEYDAYGRVFSGAGGGGQGAGPAGFEGFDWSDFAQGRGFQNGAGFEFDLGEIFGDFFGGRQTGSPRAARGRDISIDLELPFSEALFGTERRVLIAKTSRCETCKGSGAKPGSPLATCKTCNGKGKIRETRRSILGSVQTVRACSDCQGSGQTASEHCVACKGAGLRRGQEEAVIRVPAGIDDGEVIRLSGAGEAVKGGSTGDLYVKVHVARHPLFKKEGNNLVMDLTIKLSSALLGDEYTVKALDGDITVKIPAGLRHGEILRVKGRGVPIERSARGDLLLKMSIGLPQKLSKEAKKLIEELRKEGV